MKESFYLAKTNSYGLTQVIFQKCQRHIHREIERGED